MSFIKSEAGAILLWLLGSLVAASLLMPWLYDAGKNLATSAATHDYSAAIESVARSAGRAKPDRFFSRALLFSALSLLPLLVYRIKSLPKQAGYQDHRLIRSPWGKRLASLGAGLLIGAGCLGLLALVLEITNAATPKENPISPSKIFSKAFIPALGAGVVEELVFRGLLLGLWLRACSVRTALAGSALLFSFVHFLSPPDGMVIADPRAWHAGFEILASTLGHFTNPTFFITEFATLALLGLILGWCRIKSRSLWLPIGLHAGLVFSLKTFSLFRNLDPDSALHPWFIGNDLKTGILPILALGVCFACCAGANRLISRNFPDRLPN